MTSTRPITREPMNESGTMETAELIEQFAESAQRYEEASNQGRSEAANCREEAPR